MGLTPQQDYKKKKIEEIKVGGKTDMKRELSRRDFIRITAIGAGVLAVGGIGLKEILAEPKLKTYAETRPLLGTFVTIKVIDTNENKARQMVRDTFTEISRLSAIMSRFDPASELYSLNKTCEITGASSELVAVVGQALSYSEMTGGAFDVTVLPLLELNQESFSKYNSPPDANAIAEVKSLVGYKMVSIKERDITLSRTGASITLDGIAVGYIVDRAAELLWERGSMSRVLVDGGGELSLSGMRQDGRPWEIGIAHPRDPGNYYELISFTNKAIATSGDYQNFYTSDYRYHHIIDPKTGISPPDIASATVLAQDTIYADALTKACFVMGKDEALSFIENLTGVEALLIDKEMKSYRTSGFPKAING
jgi:thiamine biosynthesis lipoprotein